MFSDDTTNQDSEEDLSYLEEIELEASTFVPPNSDEGEELSYAEILASAIFNGEILITIPIEAEERVKNGLKNLKSKQVTRQKEEGQPVDTSVLVFSTQISKEFAGCIDMNIQSKNRGTVKVKQLKILVNDLPD